MTKWNVEIFAPAVLGFTQVMIRVEAPDRDEAKRLAYAEVWERLPEMAERPGSFSVQRVTANREVFAG
jgi:hypothetical protein